jgi:hypothetical protein
LVAPPNLDLVKAFQTLETTKERFGTVSYTVSQSSLEQVFIKFAKEQEEEQLLGVRNNSQQPLASNAVVPHIPNELDAEAAWANIDEDKGGDLGVLPAPKVARTNKYYVLESE